MEQRAVFVDVDGTLVDHRGTVPESAKEAIRAARGNGHLVFLCTGRSVPQIWPEVREIGFDGFVAAAGGYVEVDGQVLRHEAVPVEQVRRLVEFFDARGVEYLLESNDGLFGSPRVASTMAELMLGSVTDEDVLAALERGLASFLDSIVLEWDVASIHVNKCSFLGSDLPLAEVQAALGDAFDVIPSTVPMFGRSSGELSMRGVHKAAGIEVAISHLGISRERTIAFGDGFNDLEMLEFAGVGVAMGNAQPAVKQRADLVTGAVDADGLLEGFRATGLI
ncbi:MAG TPA: HAD family hydrolase [Candidatus Nanopelagicales bacterium]